MSKPQRVSIPLLLAICLATPVALAQEPIAAPPIVVPPLEQPESVPPAPAAAAAPGQLKLENDMASIRFGLLAQPQYEALGNGNEESTAHNLFLRRARIIVGGTVFQRFEYFVETDFANLFKAAPAGGLTVKNTPGMNIQDVILTWIALGDRLKVDVGYMLPPLAHNAVQSAATLYGWDYFANTFRHSGIFDTTSDPAGRDVGVQLRGLVAGGRIEYRVGVFQGLRILPVAAVPDVSPGKVGGRNFFRVAARGQWNVLEPETGFFYWGTYLGSKRILSFGLSYDFQDDYNYGAADAILDHPLGPGSVTAQFNVAQWNGGSFIGTLPKQTAVMAEAGYRFAAYSLSPILRYEQRFVEGATTAVPDETRYVLGLAYWPFGHTSNLKVFYTRIHATPAAHDYNQFVLQWQLFFF
jgi:hypothetical protein